MVCASSLELNMEYKALKAWGKMMGSHQYYIDSQIKEAIEDKAPSDAIFKADGEWRRASEIVSSETKYRLIQYGYTE